MEGQLSPALTLLLRYCSIASRAGVRSMQTSGRNACEYVGKSRCLIVIKTI